MLWLTKESGGQWLWPVVVVVGLADVEVFVVFLVVNVIYYFIMMCILFYFIILKTKIYPLLQHIYIDKINKIIFYIIK